MLSTCLAEQVGASDEDQDACYWVTLLMLAGCTAVSFELSSIFGDDIAFRSDVAAVGASSLALLRFVLSRAGADRGPIERTRVRVDLLRTRMSTLERSFHAHCGVGMGLARRLGLGDAVVTSLQHTFARWDGKGLPAGVGGAAIPLPLRIAAIANIGCFGGRESCPPWPRPLPPRTSVGAAPVTREASESPTSPPSVGSWALPTPITP